MQAFALASRACRAFFHVHPKTRHTKKGPAKGAQIKGGRYYLVRAEGPKRIRLPLTLAREGLPAFYAALAAAIGRAKQPERMPQVVAA